MTGEGARKEKGELAPDELARVFEAARTMNLIFPQVVQGISIAMIGELLKSSDTTQAIGRFMRTGLPESQADTYAAHGSAAHAARGFEREIDPATAARLWEQEKCTAIAILCRVFLTAEDRQTLGIDTPYVRDMSNLLMRFMYMRNVKEGIASFNDEGIRIVSGLLALRMRADREGVEMLRLYAPLFQEARGELDEELGEYRNGFAAIVRAYRDTDRGRYVTAVNAHTDAMLKRALKEVRTVLKAKELPRALKGRLELFVDILEKQYSAF